MKMDNQAYIQLMSQASDKMTELYDKVKRQDEEITTLRVQLAEAREGLELLSQYKNYVEDGEVKTDKCGIVHVSDFAKYVLGRIDKVTTA